MSDVATARTRRKVIAAGVTGNVLEWYDFAVYGFYAPIIGKLFFPSDDPTVSLIASFGAFAAGFLMRPIGGFIFGHIGDKIGRKRALVLSVMLMAIPTGCHRLPARSRDHRYCRGRPDGADANAAGPLGWR